MRSVTMLLQLHHRLRMSLESPSVISPFKVSLQKTLYCEGVGFEPDIFRRFWPQDFGV